MTSLDAFDALTLEVERADLLTEHLVDRLSDLAELDEQQRNKLFALSLIAESIRAKHALIVEHASALETAVREEATSRPVKAA